LENLSGLKTFQVDRKSLSEQVAKQLQELIVNGGLNPGDKLPPERLLAEQLSVSRTVIREAVKLLQERGLVRVITGSGTYVSEMDPNIVVQSIELFMSNKKNKYRDLLEIRRFFEVNVAELAAKYADDSDINALELNLEEMRKSSLGIHKKNEILEQFVIADMKFHQALAKATKNSLIPVLLSSFMGLLFEFSSKASSHPGAPEKAIEYHEQLLSCVRKRDVERARTVMRNHISSTEEYVDNIEE
jgi:GntR family transcriptional repressor for pyruvate dehydrogenase complex